MKRTILVILSLLISTNAISDELTFGYSPRVEVAFEKFFGSSVNKTSANIEGVEISGEKISERPRFGMPITLKFEVENVEKVLLLNAGGNHYSYEGVYIEECAKEPVTVFSYIEKTKNYPKKLKVSMRTKCYQHQIVLLLWVKTTSGRFYYDSFVFNTSYFDHGY